MNYLRSAEDMGVDELTVIINRYGFIDELSAIIIGRFVGVGELSAVNSTGTVDEIGLHASISSYGNDELSAIIRLDGVFMNHTCYHQ